MRKPFILLQRYSIRVALMERNQTVLIALVAVIAIAVAASAYLDKRDITEASPIEGTWELSTVYGYNTNGEYIKDVSSVNYFGKPLDNDSMALQVLSYKSSIFNAKFMNMMICGEFLNDAVYFEFDAVDHHIVFSGVRSGNMLNVSFTCFFTQSGTQAKGMSYALHCQYIKSGATATLDGGEGGTRSWNFDELKNVQIKLDTATVAYGSNGFQDLTKTSNAQTMEITEIEGMAFAGRMDQVIANHVLRKDVIADVYLAGVINSTVDGDMYCSVMDDTGKYWILSIYPSKDPSQKKYAISMRTTDACDTYESWNQPCAIVRNYFIGEPDYNMLPTFSNFANTRWVCNEGFMMQGTGKNLTLNVMMDLKIVDQRNDTMHMRALMANMFGGDMVGLVTKSGKATELDIYFFDDLGRQYAAFMTIDENNPDIMWMTTTYLVNEKVGGAFRMEFQKYSQP